MSGARHGKEEQEERQQTDHQHDEQVAVLIHRAPAEAAGEQIAQKQAERLDEPPDKLAVSDEHSGKRADVKHDVEKQACVLHAHHVLHK